MFVQCFSMLARLLHVFLSSRISIFSPFLWLVFLHFSPCYLNSDKRVYMCRQRDPDSWIKGTLALTSQMGENATAMLGYCSLMRD